MSGHGDEWKMVVDYLIQWKLVDDNDDNVEYI
jgi:hypothetical protein